MIYEWENPILIHESIAQLSRLTGVPEALLHKDKHFLASEMVTSVPKAQETKVEKEPLEEELLKWLFFSLEHSKEVACLAQTEFVSSEFVLPFHQKLYDAFLSLHTSQKPLLLLSLLELFDTEDVSKCEALFKSTSIRIDRAKLAVTELMNRIKERNWRKKREEIKTKMKSLASLDEEQSILYAKELSSLGVVPPKISGI